MDEEMIQKRSIHMDIDVYQQYFGADAVFSDVRRRGAAVMLTSSSGGGEIRYTLTVSFFPYEDPTDFRITYDAAFSEVLYEARGRRSGKREQGMLLTLRERADRIAEKHQAKIFWDHPLIDARFG